MPKPATAIAARPSATAASSWVVNVASYPEQDSASRQVQQMQTAGYTASVQPAEIKGRTWYRVQLRGFATADAARAKATEVQDRLGYHNLWVVQQP